MFFPWGRAITPFSLRGTLWGPRRQHEPARRLVLLITLAEDTTIALGPGAVLILPASRRSSRSCRTIGSASSSRLNTAGRSRAPVRGQMADLGPRSGIYSASSRAWAAPP